MVMKKTKKNMGQGKKNQQQELPQLEKDAESLATVAGQTLQETPQITGEKDEQVNKTIKELEQAFFALKFYPVAATEESKNEALHRIRDSYKKEGETIKQLILYMIHEALAQSAELKTMYNFDFYRRKFPNADPGQVRLNVYRSMFNYNFSLEGMIELARLLAQLPGDDAAKVLSYHFSFLCAIEVEGAHILRNVIIEALGDSESEYALRCLLQYAKYTDNERLLQRIASSLVKWDQKIESLKISKKDKSKLKDSLQQVLTLEFGDSHYG